MKKETLKNTTDRRTYTILQKRETQYCFICCKRCGSFYGYCGPGTWKDRNKRNWKQKRKKQYKQT
jgi:hypothetical protein